MSGGTRLRSSATGRTQRERREATVAKLLQATIDTVAEIGYARTSIKEVCDRAGVSHGGLFRHFATREDLVVAAAKEVARRQLADVRERLQDASVEGTEGMTTAVRVLRDSVRTPVNAVFHDLLVAARTDEGLAAKLRPMVVDYYARIYTLATEIFGITADPDRTFEAVLFGVILMFDGETVGRVIHEDDKLEARRLQWITGVAEVTLRSLLDQRARP